MSRRPHPAPPDLYGRGRGDRLMRFLAAFSDVYTPATARREGRRATSPPAGPPTRLPLTVAARDRPARDVVRLRLTDPAGAPLPPWQPGAHVGLRLPSGRRRTYSLCGDPADRSSYTVAVRGIPGGGGGSVEVHERLLPGTRLTVEVPRNAFPFAAEQRVLLLAGGIGITPLLPMAREAARRGLDWRLVHTGRSRATLPFGPELRELDALAGPGRVRVLYDDEDGVPDAATLLAWAGPGTAVYCCGPAPMLDAVRGAFTSSGAGALHFERFAAAPVTDGATFTLRLRGSGETLTVPADRSALDVLLDRDPATPYSCRQGFCGVCTVRVSAGTVDHRGSRLSPAERAEGLMRVCVSRAPEGECLEVGPPHAPHRTPGGPLPAQPSTSPLEADR